MARTLSGSGIGTLSFIVLFLYISFCISLEQDCFIIKLSTVDLSFSPICCIANKVIPIFLCLNQLGHLGELPKEVIPDYESNEEFLKKVHHVLLQVAYMHILIIFNCLLHPVIKC